MVAFFSNPDYFPERLALNINVENTKIKKYVNIKRIHILFNVIDQNYQNTTIIL